MKPRHILAANLTRAMKVGSEKTRSQLGLKSVSGVAQATIGRIIRAETDATIETLQALAKVFDLEPWQLLVPDLDPKNPPSIAKPAAENENLLAEVSKVLKKYSKSTS